MGKREGEIRDGFRNMKQMWDEREKIREEMARFKIDNKGQLEEGEV